MPILFATYYFRYLSQKLFEKLSMKLPSDSRKKRLYNQGDDKKSAPRRKEEKPRNLVVAGLS